MPTEKLTDLVKMQLENGGSWEFETASVEVEYVYDYCYSMTGYGKLCVGLIDEASLKAATDKLKATIG